MREPNFSANPVAHKVRSYRSIGPWPRGDFPSAFADNEIPRPNERHPILMLEPAQIHCPYCGEPIETTVDISAGSQNYIEDCPVCCQPMEMHVEIDSNGEVASVRAHHQDV